MTAVAAAVITILALVLATALSLHAAAHLARRHARRHMGERHRREIAPLRASLVGLNASPSACPFCEARAGALCNEAWEPS